MTAPPSCGLSRMTRSTSMPGGVWRPIQGCSWHPTPRPIRPLSSSLAAWSPWRFGGLLRPEMGSVEEGEEGDGAGEGGELEILLHLEL
jgi:hypothetical protein